MGIFSIFSKKNTEEEERLNKKILELEKTILRKDKEISNLINEIERLNQANNTTINSKQLELIEKNIKETKEENKNLKQVIDEYNLSSKKERYYYKVEIERFFSAAKYKEIVSSLKDAGYIYIQDIGMEEFIKLLPEVKNFEDAKNKFQKYLTKDFVEWEVVTYLNKGERVSKLYSKSRKLLNIFNEEDIEFMEDLRKYDFSKLLDLGFKEEQIKEFEEKRDKYYLERRVSK